MATIHWPQSPWQQASALLTLFLTDQFPLCLKCLSLCISLTHSKMNTIYRYALFFLPPDNLCHWQACVTVVSQWPIVWQSAVPLPQAKCPRVTYWFLKSYKDSGQSSWVSFLHSCVFLVLFFSLFYYCIDLKFSWFLPEYDWIPRIILQKPKSIET